MGRTTRWLTFVRVLCVEWLTHLAIDRSELREICLGALLGAMRSTGVAPTAPHARADR